jgi:hypothetical protein
MLYGFTERESNANALGWYGTEVVLAWLWNMGMVMSSCVDWKALEVGEFDTVRADVLYAGSILMLMLMLTCTDCSVTAASMKNV